MKPMELLLRQDRVAPLPELPDPRYTEAVVRNRLGLVTEVSARPSPEWPLLVGIGTALVGGVLLALLLGLNPWWLAGVPAAVLLFSPILLRKGA
ncbi:MAG: hypothetical protein ACM3XM_03475 [Mycobacterium leprae]